MGTFRNTMSHILQVNSICVVPCKYFDLNVCYAKSKLRFIACENVYFTSVSYRKYIRAMGIWEVLAKCCNKIRDTLIQIIIINASIYAGVTQ